ncbi:hypothetical protein TELCIR_05573 [Teladorsagia circumcincta]|uniref:Choline/carnitine acyltransferase domain-containing protein n=1 Tax=Teladorsagia circumcincta TaxID=45464 RepID=A0A2G9US02_TELCI|nr:hypothetical protein TELCIR_05573 [Teladorsagia circumcincta]
MASGREPVEVVYDALKAAADSHKKYTLSCMTGAGMDRHLLAWKLLAAENGLPNPSILDTSAYEHMAHFQVSTSQVSFIQFYEVVTSLQLIRVDPNHKRAFN